MKCKICGHRTSGEKALPNMMKHYRKAHPQKLAERKANKPKLLRSANEVEWDLRLEKGVNPYQEKFGYCPHCGKTLK